MNCPDALLPDGETCPRCGARRAPSGIDGGSWVHVGPEYREHKHAVPINREFQVVRELVEALEIAKETIHAWHGDIAWNLYQKSPEMAKINAALAKAKAYLQ